MQIRHEALADIDSIRALTYAAFKGHPHHEPGAEPTEHVIVDKLREAGALSLSLVAEVDGEIVGHIALSPVKIGEAEVGQHWFGLGPVSVLPAKQGKGVGSQLIRQALEMMQQQGAEGLVVMGDPSYYGRFGFKHDDTIVFPGIPQDYFMALAMSAQKPNGDVSYHPAFY
ncbi:GNAT family N-acetyltransferase [Aliagarivorans taiwanensis]|uniref:GNAT family N-acetyltransferase n=1 Tax=Aliagarivorans taiwanensis TaxID=561966 RepID=UPI000422DFD7|nr:N-acetyltransferase [Aliagarivorans taiwanensis]